jgi:hypothetical protein
MRSAAAPLLSVCALLLAGCGGSGDAGEGAAPAPPSGSLEALWRAPGQDVAVVAGTTDYGPGQNRVSFLVVDKQSRLVATPTASVWIARDLRAKPFLRTTARSEPIGVPGGDDADVGAIYVAHVRLPSPGKYWLLAEPVGASRRIQALGNVVVNATSAAPNVGDRAVASRTPTLRSTGGDLEPLTTSTRPDRELYRSSVAEALAARVPFVVSFATPLFCETRTCGPTVDVVSAVRKRSAGSDVRFIHVEIYRGNDVAKGVNRWVREWRLPKEPFTFVVDRRGVVRAKFEGAFSARELTAAVQAVAGP